MVKRRSDDMEETLASQIPEYQEPMQEIAPPVSEEQTSVGQKISLNIGQRQTIDQDEFDEFERKVNATKLGENIRENAEARSGWIPIDRQLLGDRNKFYPEDWVFLVRPATVEAVRNWSMLDESNPNSIDDVFNEILKYCLSIKTNTGSQPWQAINNWDRFFFILLIREYTFVNGESKVEFYEDCDNCETSTQFTLNTQALMYDTPDESVIEYYNPDSRSWFIDPIDFGIESDDPITLYIPTIEKDMNIKNWLISEYQENDKKKVDSVFIKFLPWMLPKVSKDASTAKMQIRKAEMTFRGWDKEMFSFMNDVLKNISVTPSTNISAICPACGEEVTTKLRFPDGIGALFNVVNKHKKFGTK